MRGRVLPLALHLASDLGASPGAARIRRHVLENVRQIVLRVRHKVLDWRCASSLHFNNRAYFLNASTVVVV